MEYNKNFIESLELLFKLEGGDKYHEIEGDNGGATKYGISLTFLRGINSNANKDTIRELTKEEAVDIYWKYFYSNNNYHNISNFEVSRMIFVTAVNMGKNRPNRWIQSICNDLGSSLVVDGVIGKLSIEEINRHCDVSPKKIKEEFVNIQIREYERIVKNNPTQKKFLRGWKARAKAVL